ncbi:MAG TPA: tRNA (adenosine(37)-N6)-threonylcarbamoyltransferase complex dimerization subunit type 1 TsaB [Magnetospirillaceae bacterium]
MKTLAFDCSTTGCAAAVLDGERVLARGEAPTGRGQSEALMPLLNGVMSEARLDWPQLELIGVTVGPGSFTGLRIGLAAARGFALALGIPIAGVTTAEVLAAGVPMDERGAHPILVAIDSKRAEPFVQAFASDLTPLAPVAAMTVEAAAKLVTGVQLLVGDGAAKLVPLISGAILSKAPTRPDPVVLARLAAWLHGEGRALPPEPLYLREAGVTLPKTAP